MLGDAVRAWREKRGWTQRELAAESGLPQPYISRIERGQRTGTIETYRLLARAMAISFEELVTVAGQDGLANLVAKADGEPPRPELPGTDDLLAPFRRLIQRLGKDLDPADWEAVAEEAEALAALRARRRAARLGDSVGYHVPTPEQDAQEAPADGGDDTGKPQGRNSG